jgi:hypothetical protein
MTIAGLSAGEMERCQEFRNTTDNLSSTAAMTCVSMTIFAKSPNVLPSAHNYGCRLGWNAYTVYRELAAPVTTSSALATNTMTPSPSSPSATPLDTSISLSHLPTVTPSPPTKQSDRIWIAAVVVPSVLVCIMMIGGMVVWRGRRRVRGLDGRHGYAQKLGFSDHLSSQQQLAEYHTHISPIVELAQSQRPSELSAGQSPIELSTRQPRHELPSAY